MDVDEALAQLAVAFLESQVTDRAHTSIVVDTGLASGAVSFVGVH